uniref:Polyprotein protein n=1 Tax=Solanum tuberosum TaxID=4113 RepID=M1E049_SOLTU
MSMNLGEIEIPNMPVDPDVPLATTGDEVRVDEVVDAESKAKIDEEKLFDEQASYEGLTKLEETMIDSTVRISLIDTTMAEFILLDTPGTDAQDQSTTPSIDAPTDGATA